MISNSQKAGVRRGLAACVLTLFVGAGILIPAWHHLTLARSHVCEHHPAPETHDATSCLLCQLASQATEQTPALTATAPQRLQPVLLSCPQSICPLRGFVDTSRARDPPLGA